MVIGPRRIRLPYRAQAVDDADARGAPRGQRRGDDADRERGDHLHHDRFLADVEDREQRSHRLGERARERERQRNALSPPTTAMPSDSAKISIAT